MHEKQILSEKHKELVILAKAEYFAIFRAARVWNQSSAHRFRWGSSFGKYAKFSKKYQGVRNVSFSENFAYVLNE